MSVELSAQRHAVAIVTGGSRGIGKAIVEALVRSDVEVYFTYAQSERAAAVLVEQLGSRGHVTHAIRCDARDLAACSRMVETVIARHGRLDILVNNAAVISDRLLPLMSTEEWSSVIDTSLNGLFGASKPAAKQMMRQRSGRMINLTSVSGLMGIAGQCNYAAAKAAIIGFTRVLAKELAPWNAAVNAVAPGYVETDMLAGYTPEQRARALASVPMQRFADPDEVARLVSFLAIDAPPYLTGQTLVIDGGLSS